jgi:hypothetical protein
VPNRGSCAHCRCRSSGTDFEASWCQGELYGRDASASNSSGERGIQVYPQRDGKFHELQDPNQSNVEFELFIYCWLVLGSELSLRIADLQLTLKGADEGLAFVRDYVFARSHADLLSVRGPYNKAPKVPVAKPVMSDLDDFEENVAEQSA